MALWNFVNTGPYGLKISKRYSSYSFYPIGANFTINKAVKRENKIINFGGICKQYKSCVTFEILTWESMEKSENVQYLETTDRVVIWELHM